MSKKKISKKRLKRPTGFFLVIWESSENQFGRTKKKNIFWKSATPTSR